MSKPLVDIENLTIGYTTKRGELWSASLAVGKAHSARP
jgi:hypothetical protein